MNAPSLIIGILVMLALYLSLSQVFDLNDFSVKKSMILFCAAVGLLTTFWLNDNPAVLERYVSEIVGAGIAVVLALLIFARKSIEKK